MVKTVTKTFKLRKGNSLERLILKVITEVCCSKPSTLEITNN